MFARDGGRPDAIEVDNGDLTIYGVNDSDNVLTVAWNLMVQGPDADLFTIGKEGTMVTVNVEGFAPDRDGDGPRVEVIEPSIYNSGEDPGPPGPGFDGVLVDGDVYEGDYNVDQCNADVGDECFSVEFRENKPPLVTLKGVEVAGVAAAEPLDIFVISNSTVVAPEDFGPGDEPGNNEDLGMGFEEQPQSFDPFPPGAPAAIDVFDSLWIYGPEMEIDDLPTKAEDAEVTLKVTSADPSGRAIEVRPNLGDDEVEHRNWGFFTVGTEDPTSSVAVELSRGWGPPVESVSDTTVVFDGSFYIPSDDVGFGHEPAFGQPVKAWIGKTLIIDDEDCFSGEDWEEPDCNPFTTDGQGVGDGFTAQLDGDNWSAEANDGSWEITLDRLKHINPANQALGYVLKVNGEIDPVFTTGGAPFGSEDPFGPRGHDRGLSIRGVGGATAVIRAATAANTPAALEGKDTAGCSVFGFNDAELAVGNLDLDNTAALGGVCSEGAFGLSDATVGSENSPSAIGVRAASFDVGEGTTKVYSKAPTLELTERAEIVIQGRGNVLQLFSFGPGAALDVVDRFTVDNGGEVEVNYPDGVATNGALELCAVPEPDFSEGDGHQDPLCFGYPGASEIVENLYAYELRGDAPDYTGFTLKSEAPGYNALEWPFDAGNGQARIALVGEYDGFFAPGYMQDYRWLIKDGSEVTLKVQPFPGYQLTSTSIVYFTPGSHGNEIEGRLELAPVIDGDNVAWYTFAMPDRPVNLDIQLDPFGSSAIVDGEVDGVAGAELGGLPRGTLDRGFGGTGRLDVGEAADPDEDQFEEALTGEEPTGFVIGEFLDLEISQVILQGTTDPSHAWVDENPIAELRKPVTVGLHLEGALAGHDAYRVLREHNGEVSVLPATYDNGLLTFETDEFSTYAIAYLLSVAPTITNPTDATVEEGQDATFTVTTTGTPTPTIQWQKKTEGGEWTNITGANTTTLKVEDTTQAMNGTQYRAKATNTAGEATSKAATLRVTGVTGTIEFDPDLVKVVPGGAAVGGVDGVSDGDESL